MGSMVGARVVRKEDPRLLTGRGTYTDDLVPPGTVHLAYVRSSEAAARILSIDTKGALDLPGVLGAWTAADFDDVPPMPSLPGFVRPALATGEVHFVGEPVAVVVATDPYLAEDAAAAVVVDYESQPVVVGIDNALADGAPLVFPEHGSNVVLETPYADADAVEAALAAAPHRTSLRLVNQRLAAVPIEPTTCLADWSAAGLTLHATVQAPHNVKNMLSAFFGVPQQQVRVVAPDVGGGFGAKQSFYPEYLLAPVLSRRLGRPVKYVETRSENLVAMTHGRAQLQHIDVGYDDEGRLLALRCDILVDAGGWPDPVGSGLPTLTALMSGGCYRIPVIGTRTRAVTTHTTPTSSYRGAGRPEAAYLIERTIDVVAAELGLDPVDVRRRNFVPASEFPYVTPFPGIVYDAGDYDKSLDRLLELIDYPALRAEQAARRDDPSQPLLGIGLSTYVEMGGFGPSALFEGFGFLGGWETSNVRVLPDGSVTITTGTSPHGQGTETTFAQIASDVLGIPFDRINVIHGDTATVQEGIGTMGSRAVAVGGSAVHKSSTKVRAKMVQAAAHLLEANPDDIEVSDDGRFSVRGSPDTGIGFDEVANGAYRPTRMPEDFELGLEATSFFEPLNLTYPSGAHCCVVEVDRDTGAISIRSYVAVDDCGTVISPLLADGQVHGGVAQGIAQALYESVTYDEIGQPTASTLIDYKVPAAPDLPTYHTEFVETPTPINPLGAKGIGESGATGAPQAVVNAAVDALAHLGVRDLEMPLTPMRMWRALS